MAATFVRPSCGVPRRLTSRTSTTFFLPNQHRRSFQASSSSIPDYAFAFDIDGVLVRSSNAIPGASATLSKLQKHRIPFILLTNGGGKSESERVSDLSSKLDGIPLETSMFIQSHTPFADMQHLYGKTVLIVGGERDKCQQVAKSYGFAHAVTPGDIVAANPDIWPFSKVFSEYYAGFAKPLPRPISRGEAGKSEGLKIDAVFVFNDPRDWGLDSAIMLDLLLSEKGYLGTVSPKNGDRSLMNNGYLQDGQPEIYYSNPDLWWASSYHLSRLGQGGFTAAFDGLWKAVTGGAGLRKTTMGKPSQETYEFAENRLRAYRKKMYGQVGLNDPLKKVYMIGDNPESDIKGANDYESPQGISWTSILVKTGVYREERGVPPSVRPHVISEDVSTAVEWAMADAGKS